MDINTNQILKEIDKIIQEVLIIRHYLHANPELSLKEFKTSEFIKDQLKLLKVDVLPPFLETDVVALLNADKTGKNITLRADIDALPIDEQNGKSYCSTSKGVMHACGHDGHAAMLIGAAMVLSKFKQHLNGSVRFVFQPGEEALAAGKDLVEKGVLNNPEPFAVLALHGFPGYPVGNICSRPGNFMAASDSFFIKIKGKGGHGSAPEKTNNPILAASKIVNNIYSLPITKFSALEHVVFSVGVMKGGINDNVIPDEVVIKGTTRYFGKDTGKKIPGIFENFIKNECFAGGCEYELDYKRSYIPTVNNEEIVRKCRDFTKKYLSKSSWVDMDKPVMAAEDISYYIENNPGAMFFLGLGEDWAGLHTNSFDFNDKALRNGILFFVTSTLGLLGELVN